MIEVADLWLAAYCAASGVKLVETRRTAEGWLLFLFEAPAKQAIERWNSGKDMISARTYKATVRHFKDAVFSAV